MTNGKLCDGVLARYQKTPSSPLYVSACQWGTPFSDQVIALSAATTPSKVNPFF
jgi:hypothetical protein